MIILQDDRFYIALNESTELDDIIYYQNGLIELMIKIIEPDKGTVYDPCFGSGSMFIHCQKLISGHSQEVAPISMYGQEKSLFAGAGALLRNLNAFSNSSSPVIAIDS